MNTTGKRKVAFLAVMTALSASAADLFWTGAVDLEWDRPGLANWTNSTGKACTFSNGDNCYISDAAFTGEKNMYIGDTTLRPGSVVFDIADTLTFWYAGQTHAGYGGFRDTTGSFTKRGPGTLTIARNTTSFKNDMRCGMTIEDGKVIVRGFDGTKGQEMIGAMEYNPTFTVAAGAELRLCGRRLLSDISSMDVAAIDDPTHASTWPLGGKVVLNGGTLAIETSPDKDSTANAMRELTFNDGGAFKVQSVARDCKGDSTLDYAILRVVDKVTVAGNARPTVTIDTYSKQKWMMEPTKPVEINVADITEDDRADFVIPMRIADINCEGQEYPRGAFLKTGAGALQFTNRDSAWKGDMFVTEGTILVDVPEGVEFSNANHTCAGTTSYLGDLTDPDRTLIVSDNGVLSIRQRNMLWSACFAPTADYPEVLKTPITFANGGKLKLNNTATPNTFGPLVFDDGVFEYEGGRDGIESMIGVWGEVRITGSKVMSWPGCALGNWYLFAEDENGDNITSFNVDDINGTADCDFDFGLFLAQPRDRYATVCGFDKTGAGTMRITANQEWLHYKVDGNNRAYYGFKGEARVKAGTLQVDGLFSSNRFTVASGAYIAGTGRVNRVTLAEGAGFRYRVGQQRPLRVFSAATLPETGVIDIVTEQSELIGSHSVLAVEATGTLGGATDLSGWSVTLNGESYTGAQVLVRDNAVVVKGPPRGLMFILR